MRRGKRDGFPLSALFIHGGLFYLGWRLFCVIRRTDLRGRVVLITGGSRGLGLVLARQFAKESCKLVLCARDEKELEAARTELEQAGAEVMVQRCDVADRDRVDVVVASALARFGRIDVLVNNAGIIQVGPFDAMTPGDFERAMAVNFWGPLHLIWSVLPSMRERRRGQIVNITSIGGEIAMPHLLPYDCAKAAFLSLSEGLQAELARVGVRVTTIVPGLMRTGSSLHAQFKGNAEREFRWFSVGGSMVLTSTSAERAARRIVTSTKQSTGKLVLSWQAKLLRLAHALAPNAVIRALTLVNRMLPRERGLRFESRRGHELLATDAPSRPPGRLRRRLQEYARRFKQPSSDRQEVGLRTQP